MYRVHLTSGSFHSTLNKAGQALIQKQFNQLIQLKDQWALVVVCPSKNHDPNCAEGHIGWFVGTVHPWARSDTSSVMLWLLSSIYFKWMCLCADLCWECRESFLFQQQRDLREYTQATIYIRKVIEDKRVKTFYLKLFTAAALTVSNSLSCHIYLPVRRW